MRVKRRIVPYLCCTWFASVAGGLLPLSSHASTLQDGMQRMQEQGPLAPRFSAPSAIVSAPSGVVYVADWNTALIYALSSNGRLIARWGGRGTIPGTFQHPDCLAVDRQGNVYVGDDTGTHGYWPGFQVQEFLPTGRFIAGWGGPDGVMFRDLHGIAVDSAGNVYVADWGHSRIVKIVRDGSRPTQWAMAGMERGQFDHPFAIAVDVHDTVFVVDAQGTRLQRLSTNGVSLGEITIGLKSAWFGASHVTGLSQTGFDQLPYLQGLAVDTNGNVYVTDWARSRILKLSRSGRVQAHWPLPKILGVEPAGTDSVTVDGQGTMYVSDFWDGHIHRETQRSRHFKVWK